MIAQSPAIVVPAPGLTLTVSSPAIVVTTSGSSTVAPVVSASSIGTTLNLGARSRMGGTDSMSVTVVEAEEDPDPQSPERVALPRVLNVVNLKAEF